MPYQVWEFIDTVTRAAGRLDREQWLILSILVLVMGMVFMKGFGSRSSY